MIRWVSQSDLPEIYKALEAVGLGDPGAGAIVDIVTCPGTDTCKLGISSSRGLAGELRKRLAEKSFQLDESVQHLHIKISGCFNSCGQHHVADLGFYGVSRKVGGLRRAAFSGGARRRVGAQRRLLRPAGRWRSRRRIFRKWSRASRSAMSPTARPAKRFKDFVKRIGKVELKKAAGGSREAARRSRRSFVLQRLGRSARIHSGRYGTSASAREKWFPRSNSIWPPPSAKCSRRRLRLRTAKSRQAGKTAYQSMLHAAKALVKIEHPDISDDPDEIVGEFRTRYLRHAEILGSVCRRKVRELPLRRARESERAVHG